MHFSLHNQNEINKSEFIKKVSKFQMNQQRQIRKNNDKEKNNLTQQNKQPISSNQQTKNQKTQLQYLNKYKHFFSINQEKELQKFHFEQNAGVFYDKLKKQNIQICKQFSGNFEIVQMNYSRNFEVVQCSVKMGYLKMPIAILNTNLQKIIQNELDICNQGAFGDIFLAQFCGQNYAIKKIQYINFGQYIQKGQTIQKESLQSFVQVLREYFFARIFSALEAGPKIKKIFGFDLIMNLEAIYFSMEICQQITSLNVQDLKKLLKMIHSLKIIHRDIKPSNLMFSFHFNKCVFIDFGSCLFIQQIIGFKTLTKFYGTLRYCTQQIAKQFEDFFFADLYYNDVFALQMTIKEINDKILAQTVREKLKSPFNANIYSNQIQQEQKIQKFFGEQIYLIKCKYFLWEKNIKQFKQFINQNIKIQENFQEKILDFLQELVPCEEQIQFYQRQISEESRKNQKFQNLSLIYTKQFTFSYQYQKFTQNDTKSQEMAFFIKFYLKLSLVKESFPVYIKKAINFKKYDQKFQFERKEDCLMNLEKIKKMKKQEYLQLVLDYISFTENYFSATTQNKIKACEIFLQFLRLDMIQMQLEDQSLSPIVSTLFYLKKQGLNFIKSSKKIEFFMKILKNLFLLGANIYKISQQLLRDIQWQKQLCFKNKFIYVWQLANVFNLYFKNIIRKNPKNSYRFSYQNMKLFYDQLLGLQCEIFANQTIIKEPVLTELLDKICMLTKFQKQSLLEKAYQDCMNLINNRQRFNSFTQSQYLQFNLGISCYVKSQVGKLQTTKVLPSHFNVLSYLKNKVSPYKYKQIPIYLSLLIKQNEAYNNYSKIGRLLDYLDKIINLQSRSIRYFIKQRLTQAYYKVDSIKVNQISQVILELKAQNFMEDQNCVHSMVLAINAYAIYTKDAISYDKVKQIQKIVQGFHLQSYSFLIQTESAILNYFQKQYQIFQQNQEKTHINSNFLNFSMLQFYLKFLVFFFQTFKFKCLNKGYNQFFNLPQYQPRVQCFQKISQYLLREPQKYPFYFYSYLQVIHKIHRESKKHNFLKETIQKLYLIRPQLNSLLQNFKNKKILPYQDVYFIYLTCYSNFYAKDQHVIIQNCKNLLKLHYQLINHNQLQLQFDFEQTIYRIWCSLIACNTSNEEKIQYLAYIVNFFAQNYAQNLLHFFHANLSNIFLHQYKNKSYNSVDFISTLIQSTKSRNNKNYKFKENSYWSLIFYFCFKNKKISIETRLNLIKRINQKLGLIKPSTRQIILDEFYFMINESDLNMKVHKGIRTKRDQVLNKWISKMLKKNSRIGSMYQKKIMRFKKISYIFKGVYN